jgi:adenylate cyclase
MIRDEADLKMYVDENVADDLQNTGREQELALFFLDIKNFTPFIEKYLPFDVIHIVRRLFSLFRQCIEHNKGRIIETAGDGFYAVFGFESTTITEAANQAFSAAESILSELEEMNHQYFEKHFYHHFEAGVGLHAGKVIVGNIGIGVNNNMTVMGLPVNIASRIQTATRILDNSIVVSDLFYDLLAPKPPCTETTTNLKGVSGPMRVHLCGKPYRK